MIGRHAPTISAGGPGALSFNEFNPIFNRDGLTLQTSGLVGENSTYAGEGVVSGIYKNTSFSVGGLYYTTDGFRENTDQQDDIATAFVQQELSPSTSIQAEYRRRHTEVGDIHQRFFPEDFFPSQRNDEESQNIRVGARHAFSPSSIVLGSFTYGDAEDGSRDDTFDARNSEHAFGGELQHLFRSRFFNLTSGLGYFDVDSEIVVTSGDVSQTIPNDVRHINVYGYGYINLLKNAVFTLGASVDSTKGSNRVRVKTK